MNVIPRLKVVAVSKSYPGCQANQAIDLCLYPGEIHALLGENGAGKSTLMKIIYGAVQADRGRIEWNGQPVAITNPAAAKNLGISMVFQHFSLFETLTVTENIALGLSQRKKWDLPKLARKIQELSEQYRLSVEPHRPIHALSVGERQRVEILRCLIQSTHLLILDEPTSVLTPQETENLFIILRQIASEGCSILLSSHKLREVQSICDNATVLRDGKVVAQCQPQLETPESLTRMMIGSEIPAIDDRKSEPGSVRLRVNNLSVKPQHPFGIPLQQIQFDLYAREIAGIAGVSGNGQAELLAALSGEHHSQDSMIQLNELAIGRLRPAERRRLGLAYAPEDRLHKGVVPTFSLADNALLTSNQQGLVKRGLIRSTRLKNWTEMICTQFDVKQAGIHSPAQTLSGGNLQKFIMGREMLQNPQVLIVAHPTWGVDVHATSRIHHALRELRNAGAAILIVPEDLDELLTVCDRIAALSKGRLSPFVPAKGCDMNKLGRWMGGIESDEMGVAHAY